MTNRRSNFATAFETTLSGAVNATDTSFTVTTTSGAPSSPCYLVFDPDDDTKREVVWCDSTFDSTHFRTASLSNRHLAGSAASSGLTHDVGAIVAMVTVGQMFVDLHDRVSQHTHGGGDDGANIPAASVVGLSGGGGGGGGTTTRIVGEVVLTATPSVPSGWLRCQGQAISRTTYSALYAAIGTTYGAGNGTTTFNLPDLRDRVPMGASTGDPRGSLGGTETVTLTTGNLPSHSHSVLSHTHSVSLTTATDSHSHSDTTSSDSHSHGGSTGSDSHSHTGTTGSDNHSHSYSDATVDNLASRADGGGTAYNSTQVIGKTTGSDSHSHSFSTGSDLHSHSVSTTSDSHSHSVVTTTDSHNHSVSGSTGGTSPSTSSTGSGAGFDNRGPYLAMDYLIYHGAA